MEKTKYYIPQIVLRSSVANILFFLFAVSFTANNILAEDTSDSGKNDELLIEQWIQSKGAVISFDSSNIKQFWTDKSVVSKDGLIGILLQDKKSTPQKIQLSNVIETMDCKVDVLSENTDLSFAIVNSNSKVLSNSSIDEDFIRYHITSAAFHLEDTRDFSFNLVFSSKTHDTLEIKKIILSFSENKHSALFPKNWTT